MMRAPVVHASFYDLSFVSLESEPALETIYELIEDIFLFIGIILGDEDCTTAIGLHVLHDCG